MKMKRYLLFAGQDGEAQGGLDDLITHRESLISAQKTGNKFDWAEILDTKTGDTYTRPARHIVWSKENIDL
jgi:hypothetical protein